MAGRAVGDIEALARGRVVTRIQGRAGAGTCGDQHGETCVDWDRASLLSTHRRRSRGVVESRSVRKDNVGEISPAAAPVTHEIVAPAAAPTRSALGSLNRQ